MSNDERMTKFPSSNSTQILSTAPGMQRAGEKLSMEDSFKAMARNKKAMKEALEWSEAILA